MSNDNNKFVKDELTFPVLTSQLVGSDKKGWNHVKFIFELPDGEAVCCMAHKDHAEKFDSFKEPKFFKIGVYATKIQDGSDFFRSLYVGAKK